MRVFIYILLALFSALTTFAGNDAGRESQFSIGSGTRALGMGGGFVGLADDASAIYWNQAALGALSYQQAEFMHSSLFEGSLYDIVSYAYPHHRLGGIGISFMRLGVGDIVRRVDWQDEGSFDYSIMQFIVGYGRELEGGIYAGGALKLLSQSLDQNSSYGVGADLSFYKPFSEKLSVGLILQDIIPPEFQLDDQSEAYPFNVIFGLGAKDIKLNHNITQRYNIGVELPEDRSAKIHAGVETSIYDAMDVRVGYDRDNLSFGAGFNYKRFRLDYAYKLMDGISDSHRFGLNVKIGPSVQSRIDREAALQNARGSYLILDDRLKQYEYYRGIADRFFMNNDIDSAYVYYQRSLAYRKDDEYILSRIDRIEQFKQRQIDNASEKATGEQIKRALLDNYYSEAETNLTSESFTVSRGFIDLALKIDPGNARFTSLYKQWNTAVENKIVLLLEEAREAEKEGRITDAVRNYYRILDLSPDDSTVRRLIVRVGSVMNIAELIKTGVENFYSRDLKASTHAFQNVLSLDSGNEIAIEYLRKISLSGKEEETTIETPDSNTRKVNIEDDEKVWPTFLLALSKFDEGKYQEAIDLWQDVLEVYPGDEKTLEHIRDARLKLNSDNGN